MPPVYRRIVRLILSILVLTGWLPHLALARSPVIPDGFADPAFLQLWRRNDGPVAAGQAVRSWTWGPWPGERRYERYDQAPAGVRLVQYFDKGRMEINDPTADRRTPWFVTGGLLVVELIGGRIQVGEQTFVSHPPAAIPVAGDLTDNPDAPTYAMLAPLVGEGANRAPPRLGQPVSATFGPSGPGDEPTLAFPETAIVRYDEITGRNVPQVFEQFIERQRNGLDPLFVFGRPITEPFWARVRVAGHVTPVLIQAFERRLLTYTPSHPDPWKVEMGNVGQHYMHWRHGRPLRYALPPPPQSLGVRETTIAIATYDLTSALQPTRPDDPIFPYDRLDWRRIGPLRLRTYRALIVENRFLTLTFLPELGGRLLQVTDRSSGRSLFYQNPVIKPSPFGQRGWWLAVGGLEWVAPTGEHGYLEYRPWDLSVRRSAAVVTVTAATTERQRGFALTSSVTLRADESRLTARLTAQNPTNIAQPLQLWTNAMLSPSGDNRAGPGLRFVVPAERMLVHATADKALPGPGEPIAWPYVDGRDLSDPTTWTGYLGAFTAEPTPFLGVYDLKTDQGAAVIHGSGVVGGKIFGFSSTFDSRLYTDDASAYVELWSGAQATFWDEPPLPPRATRAVETTWLPLWGLGRLVAAEPEGALGLLRRADGGLTVTLFTPRIVPRATVVLALNDQEVFRSLPLTLRPDLPLAIELPPGVGGRLRIEAPEVRLEAASD